MVLTAVGDVGGGAESPARPGQGGHEASMLKERRGTRKAGLSEQGDMLGLWNVGGGFSVLLP